MSLKLTIPKASSGFNWDRIANTQSLATEILEPVDPEKGWFMDPETSRTNTKLSGGRPNTLIPSPSNLLFIPQPT